MSKNLTISDKTENDSSQSGLFELYGNIWISVVIFHSIFIVISMWAIISFISYGKRKGKWEKNQNFTTKVLITLATLTPCFTLLRLILNSIIIIIGSRFSSIKYKDQFCEVIEDLTIILFFFALLPTYFFLWFRQRVFYTQPSFAYLYTTTIKVLSWASVTSLCIGGVFTVSMITLPLTSKMESYGCEYSLENTTYKLYFYIGAVIMIFSQIIIFTLFVYPLRVYKKTASKQRVSSTNKVNERMIKANRLATISMLICVISDFFPAAIVALALHKKTSTYLFNTTYDVSLIVNIFCIMLSFEDYKEIIFVRFKKNEKSVKGEKIEINTIVVENQAYVFTE